MDGGKELRDGRKKRRKCQRIIVLTTNTSPIACICSVHISLCHRQSLMGQPGHVLPIIEKRPCIYHFLPSFAPPNILVCPPNIFDKSMSVAFAILLYCH